jgi:amino acid transporter
MHGGQGQLQRRLGVTSAIMITVGAVIGSGIFMKPLEVSRALPGEGWVYLVWLALGLVCLFGAFAYAELGAMYPQAGGQYSFLREGWGRFPAFLYGWTFFWVINSGTMAALAVAFATNLLPLFGVTPEVSPFATIALSCAMIVGLAVVNHVGVLWGAVLQNVSTFAKIAALVLIAVGGFLAVPLAMAATPVPAFTPPPFLSGLVAACIAIFWAYEGWYQLPYNAAELKRPERDLPRGLIWGMLLLIAIYLAIHAAYFHVLPLEHMRVLADAPEVPRRTVEQAFGTPVAANLAMLIAISVLGAANPNLLSSPRAFYEMAKDGLVPRPLMYVHPKYGTPVVSIWTQALIGCVLVIVLREFRDITIYVVFASLLFYALTVAAVYRLRRTRPDQPRPYRCFGYPLTPALFIAVTLFVDGYTLSDPIEQKNALIGLAIIATGVPAYLLMQRHRPGTASR